MHAIRLSQPDRYDRAQRLLAALGLGEAAIEPARAMRLRYLDSFDWRLHRAGLSLAHDGSAWRLIDQASGRVLAAESIPADRWPRFGGDFPLGGSLRGPLQELLGVRALIQVVAARGEETRWRLVDREHGIALRGRCLVLQQESRTAPALQAVAAGAVTAGRLDAAATAAPVRWLELHPADAGGDLAAALRARADDLGCAPLGEPPLVLLLRAAGLAPGGYSSRFSARLDPAMSARAALVTVSRALVRTMRRNEAGIVADVDTEFLHDFRVAVRRQRSALVIFKGVLPPATRDVFVREFAALGRLTGPLRDLDVKLLAEQRWRDLVPGDLRVALEPLFARLRAQRLAELQRVRLALASPEYRRLHAAWRACLAGSETGPRAEVPARKLARRSLRRRHDRVLRDGRRIGTRADDGEKLHRLRIQAKKLRYLLEFFASLLPPREVAALIKKLKRLQDNLGAGNDLGVQIAFLQADRDRPDADPREAAALDALIAALGAEQRRVRRRFARTFAAFDSSRIAARFARLLR